MNTQPARSSNLYRIGNTIRYGIGLTIGVMGVVDMVPNVVPKLNWAILAGTWPVDVHHNLHGLTIVIGFFLVLLSFGLMRGKRQAWRITLLLILVSILLHIHSGSYALTNIVTVALAGLLLICSRHFQARSDPPSLRRGYMALLIGLTLGTFYTTSGFLALSSQFSPVIHSLGLKVIPLKLFTLVSFPLSVGTHTFFFEHVLPILCLSIVVFAMLQILHPVSAVLQPDEQERRSARALVQGYGKNSISYFSLGGDKSYFFSASGKSIISYALAGNVAVVAGDPIGPEQELASSVAQFMAFCQKQDWAPVFWQVRGDLAGLYRGAGFHLLKIGEDAIIPTAAFTLKGGAMANVRSSAKRAEKEGLRVVFYRGEIESAEQLFQMQMISREWLANKGGSEMGFSLGHFDTHIDDEQVSALAVDRSNRVHGFITFVPIYGRHGWGLDLMRRRENCAPGTMELLLACSIDHLRSCGAETVSLGLAPLGNVNNESISFLDNSVEFLAHRFGDLRQSQSLFKFKQKFHPHWESRYLAFPHTLTLPKVGWALYVVHQQKASWLAPLYSSLHRWQGKFFAARRKSRTLANQVTHPGTGQLTI